MPVFLAALIGGLAAAAGSIAGRVLLGLGFSFVAYAGIDAAVGALKAQFYTEIALLPAVSIQILGLLKVGVAVNMFFSALAGRLVIMGLTSGVITRLIAKA
jgi:hypothetical protein